MQGGQVAILDGDLTRLLGDKKTRAAALAVGGPCPGLDEAPPPVGQRRGGTGSTASATCRVEPVGWWWTATLLPARRSAVDPDDASVNGIRWPWSSISTTRDAGRHPEDGPLRDVRAPTPSRSEAHSLLARLWRWHTTWCPGWKAYQKDRQAQEGELAHVR
jgi:hypothetical protein